MTKAVLVLALFGAALILPAASKADEAALKQHQGICRRADPQAKSGEDKLGPAVIGGAFMALQQAGLRTALPNRPQK